MVLKVYSLIRFLDWLLPFTVGIIYGPLRTRFFWPLSPSSSMLGAYGRLQAQYSTPKILYVTRFRDDFRHPPLAASLQASCFLFSFRFPTTSWILNVVYGFFGFQVCQPSVIDFQLKASIFRYLGGGRWKVIGDSWWYIGDKCRITIEDESRWVTTPSSPKLVPGAFAFNFHMLYGL